MADVSIIIVNYNTKLITANCIQSIIDTTKRLSFEIIVVDNHSGDGSVEYLRDRFPDIRVLSNDETWDMQLRVIKG